MDFGQPTNRLISEWMGQYTNIFIARWVLTGKCRFYLCLWQTGIALQVKLMLFNVLFNFLTFWILSALILSGWSSVVPGVSKEVPVCIPDWMIKTFSYFSFRLRLLWYHLHIAPRVLSNSDRIATKVNLSTPLNMSVAFSRGNV